MSQPHEEPTADTETAAEDVAGQGAQPERVEGDTPETEPAEAPTEDPTAVTPEPPSEAVGEAAAAVDTDEPDTDAVDDGRDGATTPSADEDAASASTRRSRRVPSRDLLEKEGEIAADFLETLLDICDLDGDLDVDIEGDRAAVSIVDSDEGRVPRRLVGSDGKVLDALQELTRLAVYSSTGERSRLILDIAGHRADRRTTLVAQAQHAITAVRESGEQQAMEPMSAFERKIVHDEVLAAGLHSESDGVEPRRFVVVLPA